VVIAFRNNTGSEECSTSGFSEVKKKYKKIYLVNIYLPSLHIKLAFIKIFVKSMDKACEEFADLRRKIPKISEAKMK
jgi:hypothetical protein